MGGLMAPTPGLVMWNPTSTARMLGLTTDVCRDYDASASLETTSGKIDAGSNALVLKFPIDFRNGQGIRVSSAGPEGQLLVTTIVGGAGTRHLTLAANAATAVTEAHVEHDDSWAWQAAIDGATAPTVITCPPGSSMKIAATLCLKSDVLLCFPASTLIWTGPKSGTVFNSPAAAPLLRSGIVGGRVDPGEASRVIDLHSPQYGAFDLEILDGSSTLTAMRWAADVPQPVPPKAFEASGNIVHRLVAGRCGTLLALAGQSGGLVSQNTFLHLEGRDCLSAGIVCEPTGFVQTNTFLTTRVTLNSTNTVGVDLGQSDTASGICDVLFVDLRIDNTSQAYGTGLYLRTSSKVQVLSYSYSGFPPGTPVNGGQAVSYYIRDTGVEGPPAMQDSTAGWSVAPLQVSPAGTPVTNHVSDNQLVVPPGPVLPEMGNSTTVQVKGVQPGDTVIATPDGVIPPGLAWNAAPTASGTITLYLVNVTKAPLMLQPMHWRFDVWQHAVSKS